MLCAPKSQTLWVYNLYNSRFSVRSERQRRQSDGQYRIPVTAKALLLYSQQTQTLVVAPAKLLRGKTAPPISGNLSREKALAQLLENTGLTYSASDKGVVRIFRDEQAESIENVTSKVVDSEKTIEHITVTGSHIRGAKSGSPMIVFDRKDIQIANKLNTQVFFRS